MEQGRVGEMVMIMMIEVAYALERGRDGWMEWNGEWEGS